MDGRMDAAVQRLSILSLRTVLDSTREAYRKHPTCNETERTLVSKIETTWPFLTNTLRKSGYDEEPLAFLNILPYFVGDKDNSCIDIDLFENDESGTGPIIPNLEQILFILEKHGILDLLGISRRQNIISWRHPQSIKLTNHILLDFIRQKNLPEKYKLMRRVIDILNNSSYHPSDKYKYIIQAWQHAPYILNQQFQDCWDICLGQIQELDDASISIESTLTRVKYEKEVTFGERPKVIGELDLKLILLRNYFKRNEFELFFWHYGPFVLKFKENRDSNFRKRTVPTTTIDEWCFDLLELNTKVHQLVENTKKYHTKPVKWINVKIQQVANIYDSLYIWFVNQGSHMSCLTCVQNLIPCYKFLNQPKNILRLAHSFWRYSTKNQEFYKSIFWKTIERMLECFSIGAIGGDAILITSDDDIEFLSEISVPFLNYAHDHIISNQRSTPSSINNEKRHEIYIEIASKLIKYQCQLGEFQCLPATLHKISSFMDKELEFLNRTRPDCAHGISKFAKISETMWWDGAKHPKLSDLHDTNDPLVIVKFHLVEASLKLSKQLIAFQVGGCANYENCNNDHQVCEDPLTVLMKVYIELGQIKNLMSYWDEYEKMYVDKYGKGSQKVRDAMFSFAFRKRLWTGH